MSWYALDAVEVAFERTKSCLLEPLEVWKWLKLAIIMTLITLGIFSLGNYPFSESDISFISSMPADELVLLLAILLIIFFISVIITYIASVMEFVLVESLVSNEVRFWNYTRRLLGKGFGLMLFRFLIWMVFFIISLLALLPLISLKEYSDLALIFFAFVVIILAMVNWVGGIIISFLVSLAVPVSSYTDTDIFKAFSMILKKFRQDWQQMIVYWLVITGLIIIGTFVFMALFLIVSVIAIALFLVFFALLVAVSDAILSGDELVGATILILFSFIFTVLYILALGFIMVPLSIFLEYHMITFLQMWYPEVEIPMFDTLRGFTTENGITSL